MLGNAVLVDHAGVYESKGVCGGAQLAKWTGMMQRRSFLQQATLSSMALWLIDPCDWSSSAPSDVPDSLYSLSGGTELPFVQRPWPYAFEALEPHIDAETMRLHYGKHHVKYVEEANKALAAAGVKATTAEELFAQLPRGDAGLRNNAGGAWNHDLFWSCMRPSAGLAEWPGKLTDALSATFGSVERFKEVFSKAARTHFGSGWVWLVEDAGQLRVGTTRDQDNPLMPDSDLRGRPLLALDLWEHAYYLHYKNDRAGYIAQWWNVVDTAAIADRL